MRKVTYTNSVNGLSMAFSSESATNHLDLKAFDGCSTAATAVTYTPALFDGQKLVSLNLSPRTIVLPVQIAVRSGGKYSRKDALDIWDKLLKTFVPLHEGILVWTDGTSSRQIKCRTSETPKITEVLPFLFSATISLIADFPYWEDCAEQSLTVESSATAYTISNSCGLAVPIYIDVPASGSNIPFIYNRTLDCGIVFASAPDSDCVVDTKECTVTLSDGTLANNLLTVNSEFFWLAAGDNEIQVLDTGDSGDAVIRWRNLYLGVK